MSPFPPPLLDDEVLPVMELPVVWVPVELLPVEPPVPVPPPLLQAAMGTTLKIAATAHFDQIVVRMMFVLLLAKGRPHCPENCRATEWHPSCRMNPTRGADHV
jgi:hypothetical protein